MLYVDETFENHWINLTSDEYHADKTAVGSSGVAKIKKSPYSFYMNHFEGKETPSNDSMKIGTLAHKALLEGKEFKLNYCVMPEFWGYTKDGKKTNNANSTQVKEQKERWLLERKDNEIVIEQDELEQIEGMINSVKKHPESELVFANGLTEMSGYYRDPTTGIKCKIRPDFKGNDNYIVTDFKTARSSDKYKFSSHAFENRLDLRLWMYAFGISQIEKCPMPKHLVFMVCEKKYPYEAAVFYMNEEQKVQAEYDYRRAMARLDNCLKTNTWPSRQTKMEELYTPKFFIDNDVEEHEEEIENN